MTSIEQRMLALEEHLRLVIEGTRDHAIFTVDIDGHVVTWNEGAHGITGYDASEIIGKHLSVFRGPAEGAPASPTLRGALKTATEVGRVESELWHVRKDGTTFWSRFALQPMFAGTGALVGFLAIVRDLSEQLRIGEEQRRADDQFRGLMESAPDAMVIADKQGTIMLVNVQTERLFGYARIELIGQAVEILIPERFRGKHPAHREDYFLEPKARGVGAGLELYGRRMDGSEFPIEISLSRLETDKGTLVSSSIRDITERRRAEEKFRGLMEEQNRRMQESNRLKSEFLANMSHELRTPLHAIIGFAELLHNGKVGAISVTHKEYLGDILKSSNYLLQLINDVLDLAKVESGKIEFRPEEADLGKIVGEVRDILRGLAAEKRIKLTIAVDQALGQVTLDPARFKQVLYNYLSNAIKFTPEQGTVAVRLIPDGDDMFRVEVDDSGIGIKADDLHRLFVEFQQLDAGTAKKLQGTGLGLALTKRIVEAQGGEVTVASAVDVGSTFGATFPRTFRPTEDTRTVMPEAAGS